MPTGAFPLTSQIAAAPGGKPLQPGRLVVACWAQHAGDAAGVAATLLVRPLDAKRADADPRIRRFAPPASGTLPFPTLVVAGRNDPRATMAASAALAARWSARLHDAGRVGHLNAASGLGAWHEGQRLVEGPLASAR